MTTAKEGIELEVQAGHATFRVADNPARSFVTRAGGHTITVVGSVYTVDLKPDLLEVKVDEIHLEMASREFAEIEIIAEIARRRDVAVGVIDVKNYYVETPEAVAERVRLCLKHAPADRLAFSTDCGLSQTARWAAKQKLANLVAGVQKVRKELGV